MALSPQVKERLRKFRANKRAYRSLILLSTLFLLSLPAELLFNDHPLILRANGRLFFPAFKEYKLREFVVPELEAAMESLGRGGELDLPVPSYQGESFREQLNGRIQTVPPGLLFGVDDRVMTLEESRQARQALPDTVVTQEFAVAHSPWMVWAPIRHSHRSSSLNLNSDRQALASPWSETVIESDKFGVPHVKTFVGAVADGHLLGTDTYGKDVLARLVYGFRISMLFGLGLAASGMFVGIMLGAIQGYFGGVVDLFGQRLTELWGSLPRLYLLIILSSFLAKNAELSQGQHFLLLFGILSLTAWMGMATYMRAEFLKARNLEYVKAAKALGVPNFKIMLKHILPDSLTPIVTFLPFSIRAGILSLTSLDFLDLGVRYPAPSLGDLLAQGQQNLHAHWILIPTFVMICIMLMLLTFIGEGVRNAFDPRTRV